MRSTAVVLPIPTALRQNSMVAQPEEIQLPTGRQTRARTRLKGETGNRQGAATEARWVGASAVA